MKEIGKSRLAGVQISVYRSISEAEAAWRAAERGGVAYAFQSYAWLSHWHACLGHRAGVAPCLVRVEDDIAGPLLFLPLGLARRRGVVCLEWLGGEVTDYHAPIIGPGLAPFCREVPFPVLWALIETRLPAFDAIHLTKQPDAIEGLPNPMLQLGGFPHPTSAHAVRLPGSWDRLYQDTCGARTRQTDRRKERRLGDFGDVVFEPEVAPERVGPVLEALFAFKRKSYARKGARDILADAAFAEFYAGLVRSGEDGPSAQVSALTVGGRVAAAHWGLVSRGRFYYLMPAFDEDGYGGTSPGAVLYRRLLQWACDRGLHTFDFTIGDESYKERWCDVAMPLWDHVQSNGLAGKLYVAQVGAAQGARMLARKVPVLARGYGSIKRVVRSLPGRRPFVR